MLLDSILAKARESAPLQHSRLASMIIVMSLPPLQPIIVLLAIDDTSSCHECTGPNMKADEPDQRR